MIYESRKRFSWSRALVVLLAVVVVIKTLDVFVGWWMPSKSDDRIIRAKASVTLRHHEPDLSVLVRPTDEYLQRSEGLRPRDFRFRTDKKGFLLGPEEVSGPVDITFAGGSTTVCAYVDEGNRFPALVSQLLRRADGSATHTQNAGLSANHAVHTNFNLITTILPEKPRIVAVMHNDLYLLAAAGSYWTGPPSQVLEQAVEAPSGWSAVGTAKRIKNAIVPNLWDRMRDFVPDGWRDRLGFYSTDEYAASRHNNVPVERIKTDFRAALTALVRSLRAWNVEPVLMTQFNRVDLDQQFVRQQYEKTAVAMTWPQFVSAYKELNGVVRTVAKDNGALLIDLDRKVPHTAQYLYDGEHLNDEGSQLVARIIAAEIAARFSEYRTR